MREERVTAFTRAARGGAADRRQFAADVAYYLSLSPRQLPSRYLYDPLGSALFDAICRLPWYRIAGAEMRLLGTHGAAIAAAAPFTRVVELGPGNGEKLLALLESMDLEERALDVHLVDISPSALDLATRRLGPLPSVAIVRHEATYEAGLAAASRGSDGAALAIFLGSNIGNFDPPGADAFLRSVRAALGRGDAFLLGTDLVKPEPELLLAYDDPLGVTAAFNRNLLLRINRELGGDFDIARFHHRALWNAGESRVEMHLVSDGAHHVRVEAADLSFTIGKGESIWTESSYKYEPAQVVAMLHRAGFGLIEQWIDEADRFALTLVEAL